jgi:hypothetical protein
MKYYKLVEYFSRYTKKRMGVIMGANNLLDVFQEKYYRHLNGGILEAFGVLFSRDLKIYLYPWQHEETGELITATNAPIHPRLQPLFNYLKFNKRMVDIEDYNANILDIYSKRVLEMIRNDEDGWEEMVPTYVDNHKGESIVWLFRKKRFVFSRNRREKHQQGIKSVFDSAEQPLAVIGIDSAPIPRFQKKTRRWITDGFNFGG